MSFSGLFFRCLFVDDVDWVRVLIFQSKPLALGNKAGGERGKGGKGESERGKRERERETHTYVCINIYIYIHI